jgi:SAM-dependent methyltransferase
MIPTQKPHQEEATFRNYDTSAAARYAQYRRGWPDSFIENIISQHTSSGGATELLLDIGCGPGNSTRSLAPHFQSVLGVDPSPGMVEVARGLPSSTARGEPVRYEVWKAEELSSLPALAELSPESHGKESVDLITAATAAHWFDMAPFWVEAAKTLKPGGSVILWCTGGFYVDPQTTPNYQKVQQLLDRFESEVLEPFSSEGNVLCRNLYVGLKMPWDCGEEDQGLKDSLQVFDRKDFTRLEYNKDGYVAPGESFVRGGRADFDMMKKLMGTASPVERWREAHKEQLEKGEVEDLLDKVTREMKDLFAEVEEGKDRNWMDAGSSIAVLVIRKRK